MHLGEMVPCAKVVMQASHKLVTVVKHEAQLSTDEVRPKQIVTNLLNVSLIYLSTQNLSSIASSAYDYH